jgi:formamidopyrimidine-DNA glycosylase
MPELPEVETVRRTLTPAIGARIAAVWDSGMPLHMQRRPPRKKLRALVGAKITDVRRHGKYLLVDTDRPESLLVHLGMTGRFCIHKKREPRAVHTHLVLDLGTRELRFADPRRFGQLDVFVRAEERAHPALAVLGPDALVHGVDPEALLEVARRRSRSTLKAFLLDQSVIAGVGNIYASEALWRAQLRPTWRARRLTGPSARRLADAVREVIANAIVNGGTTLSDFVAADGTAGENASFLWVYDREGQPCLRCKGLIRRSVQGGRATYFCPTCQAP